MPAGRLLCRHGTDYNKDYIAYQHRGGGRQQEGRGAGMKPEESVKNNPVLL